MCATLVGVMACDKQPAPDINQVLPAGTAELDVSAHPTILFQLFGDPKDPRLMPIAAVVNGSIEPIGLSRAGWRAFDSTYFAPDTKYSVYVNDSIRGTVTVTRGMWVSGDEPLYPLPGCKDLRPLAAAHLDFAVSSAEPTIELIASSTPLMPHPVGPRRVIAAAELARMGRTLGHDLGAQYQLDQNDLDSLDFVARTVISGARPDPTLMVSFLDQQAGDVAPGVGHTSHIFALFDKIDTAYVPTYRHVQSGDARTVEFQRLIDHVDVNGDGIDEMILDAWHYAGSNDLVVLNFKAGQWHEALRASSSWCLDPPKPDASK